jgi:predicted metal-binding membrane protein
MRTGKAMPFPWPRLPLDRGQVVLLAILALLTAGSWALTVSQARTMDMPMGVAVRGAADAGGAASGMGAMPGMDMGTSAADEMGAMAASGMSGVGWS